MSYILQTNHLTKTINGKDLVKNADIHVEKGTIYGFLGPNGAGKTTIMKMITNLWKPTDGSIEIFGQILTTKSYYLLKRMGNIIEFPVFYEHMSGIENLKLHSEYMGYYHPNNIEQTLELLSLSDAGNKPVKQYSLGMKQRLGIARAVLCKPELLILDEPTNGLDPAGMKQLRDLFRRLCTEYGITIMISSHILSEVESIADTIGIIHHGVMKNEIAMKEITEQNTEYIALSVGDTQKAAYILAEMGLERFKIVDEQNIRIYDTRMNIQELSKTLVLHQVELRSIGQKAESLEDYFLKLTQESGNER